MYLEMASYTYTRLKNLSFAPQTDLIGQSLPICEFTVDVLTEDSVSVGTDVKLYDDLDNLWAQYTVVFAEHMDAGTLRIRARSALALLEQDRLPAVYYSAEPIAEVLIDVFANTGSGVGAYVYRLDSSFSGATVTGYCPEQTARDRLLWVCFTLGAYVSQCFSEYIDILPISSQSVTIPIGKTYMWPKVTYREYVTEIRCKYYAFTVATPGTTDSYVQVGSTFYVVTESEMTLTNPDAPSEAPANIVSIDGVYLVNSANVGGVLSHLARWYFERTKVDIDVIDNAEYIPGQQAVVYTDETHMASGYIESCDFRFGVQAKATMRLTGASTVESGGLTILYMYGAMQINRAAYRFPVGLVYSIPVPYIDINMNGHRYIFRPEHANTTGTMAAGEATVQEPEHIALDLDMGNLHLHVISVDAVSVEDDTIGVIE